MSNKIKKQDGEGELAVFSESTIACLVDGFLAAAVDADRPRSYDDGEDDDIQEIWTPANFAEADLLRAKCECGFFLSKALPHSECWPGYDCIGRMAWLSRRGNDGGFLSSDLDFRGVLHDFAKLLGAAYVELGDDGKLHIK